jgi:hypothetical protein
VPVPVPLALAVGKRKKKNQFPLVSLAQRDPEHLWR